MSASEVIKLTAIPSGVDTTSETFYVSVVLSPELSGGDGTLVGTDFVNWPDTLGTYQNDNGSYGPAYWDVVLSDGGGTVLFEYLLFLQTYTMSSALWESVFPATTKFEGPDSAQTRSARTRARADAATFGADDRFRSIPIISYPATQIADFVLGQYQHYSPTQVPDFETISAVYAPVTEGLIGVVGQEQAAAQAREREAQSRGGTRPAANDFTDASTAEAFAAFKAYQVANSGPAATPSVGTIDFHAALAFIGQHGVLQRALGLVFDLAIPYGSSAAAQNVFSANGSEVYLSVSLYSQADPPSGQPGTHKANGIFSGERFPFTQVCPRTRCDASSTTFNASSITGSIVRGILDGADPADLKPVPISIIGDVNATSKLPYELMLRQRAEAKKGDYTSGDFEPYQNLYTPPPSLRSNGLTLARVNAGFSTAQQIERSYLAGDAASGALGTGDGSQLLDFAAEDLVRGLVLDVLDTQNGVWRSTAEREVTYTSGSTQVGGSTSEPFDEAATQVAPHIVYPPDVESEQLTMTEVILSWNGWSNAVARPGTPLNDNDYALGPGTPPFNLSIAESVPPGRLPPLRFGHTYQMRVRVIDLANNKVSVSDPANNRNYTAGVFYGRLEPVASPDVYPQGVPRLGESQKTLVIRDIDQDKSSLRVLYPQRVSEQFAEAHGMFDNASGDPDPSAYATIVPRDSGQYPDPPLDDTQPTTIDPTEPVPFLPDPLARGAAFEFFDIIPNVSRTVLGTANVDFSPQNGAGWPDYRPFALKVVAGSAFGTSVDENQRVLTVTLSPGDDVTAGMTATCEEGDVALLATPRLFKGTPDPTAVAGGTYWSVTPEVDLELVYAVQKPLATPELQLDGESSGIAAEIDGKMTWSPKTTAEVDVIASWSEPVDDPAKGQLQGPGTHNPALRDISNSPVTTLVLGNLVQVRDPYVTATSGDDYQLNATDTVAFTHHQMDTKHRVVSYSGIASSRFAEYYPEGTDVSVLSAAPSTVNILSSAPPDAPVITDIIPIYDWSLSSASDRVVSERGPSGLRVLLARPWWSSGIGELLAVLINSADETDDKFTILPESGQSDWAADPVFGSAALPSRHPRQSSFPNAVRVQDGILGHAVAFDYTRGCWYSDIKVDTGAAYTPMIRLALVRWQPDSVAGAELSKVVMTDVMSLDPGRTLTIVRGSGGSLSSVQLTGPSYGRAATFFGPGAAQLQVQRRDSSIDDETLGWQMVGPPIVMHPSQHSVEPATWTARNVDLPGPGPHRVVVAQYEILPGGDDRVAPGRADDVTYTQPSPGREYRLVHQDVVEV